MKPENRETTTIELAAVFYVRKRKNPFFEICMQYCKVPRNCTKCCKNPLQDLKNKIKMAVPGIRVVTAGDIPQVLHAPRAK